MTGRLAVVVLVVATSAVVPVGAGAVVAENESPLADVGLDQRAERGENVHLDATGSRDPDGEIVGFEWRIETPGGDVVRPGCSDCARTRFSVDQVGRYAVTVTVTDDRGATSTDTLFVDVETADGGPSQSDGNDGPSVTMPTTNSAGGTPSVSSDVVDCVGACGETTEPWIEIHGPSTAWTDEEVTFDVEYGGFSSEPQFGWSIGASGSSGRTSWASPGKETIYVTAANSESELASDAHGITVTKNQKPEVIIQAPENVVPGERITLSAEVSDPDGQVVRTEWDGGPSISIPKTEGISKVTTATVIDNFGAKSTDSITINSDSIQSIKQGRFIAHEVYCYYNESNERTNQSPDYCKISGTGQTDTGDGLQANTGNLDRMLESANYDIVWKKTTNDVNAVGHSGGLSDSLGVRMPDIVDNDATSPSNIELSDDQRSALRGGSVRTETESFTLDGETVSNDLDGDGEVNAADWDERYGRSAAQSPPAHRDIMGELKDSQQALRKSGVTEETAGGSASDSSSNTSEEEISLDDQNSKDTTASDEETTSYNVVEAVSRHTSHTSSDTGGNDGTSGGDTSTGSGSSSDSQTNETSGDRAAEKGRTIANSTGMSSLY